MTNSENLLKKPSLFEISLMSRLIQMENSSQTFDNVEMAAAISAEFGVNCTKEDIDYYCEVTRANEDYELEQRKMEYYHESIH